MSGPPETGPSGVWSNLALTGKEDRVERREAHTEQIVRKLREADRLSGAGARLVEVAKAPEVSEAKVGRWRSQYGGMRTDEAKELRRLRDENGRLKRMVADLSLDNEMLKEVARGKF